METLQEFKARMKEELKDVWPFIFGHPFSIAAEQEAQRREEEVRRYAAQATVKEAELSELRLILAQDNTPEIIAEGNRLLPILESEIEELHQLQGLALQGAQTAHEEAKQMKEREDKEIADFWALPVGEQIAKISRAEQSYHEVQMSERRKARAVELKVQREAEPQPKAKR